MSITRTERHQIENEMIFRRANEKVAKQLAKLDAMHIEDGNDKLVNNEDFLLFFKCECSDEDCNERVKVLLSTYKEIHSDRDAFIVLPHHEIDKIESVIKRTKDYIVVKKNNTVPEPIHGLNETPSNNT